MKIAQAIKGFHGNDAYTVVAVNGAVETGGALGRYLVGLAAALHRLRGSLLWLMEKITVLLSLALEIHRKVLILHKRESVL